MIKATSTIVEKELLKGVKLHLRYNSSFRKKSTLLIGILLLILAAWSVLLVDPDFGIPALGGAGVILLFSYFF